MRLIIILLLIVGAGNRSFSQDSTLLRMMLLNDNEAYQAIIQEFDSKRDQLSAKALFYLGKAYYMLDKDSIGVVILDMSIKKDPNDAEAHYTRASSLFYQGRYSESIMGFERAIELSPKRAAPYLGIGDAWRYKGDLELAREWYQKAAELDTLTARPLSLVADTYMDEKKYSVGLEWLYKAKARAAGIPGEGQNVRYNIGLIQYLHGDIKKSQEEFESYVKDYPDDYQGYSKLIQVYYRMKAYDKAEPYRKMIYAAQKESKLPEYMEDAFCFDQFVVNGLQVRAFERYEEGQSQRIYYKHIFYVLNDKDEVEYTVQTEYSPYAVGQKIGTYFLGKTKGNFHATYSVVFKDEINYDELKEQVMNVISEKITPGSSSVRGN